MMFLSDILFALPFDDRMIFSYPMVFPVVFVVDNVVSGETVVKSEKYVTFQNIDNER